MYDFFETAICFRCHVNTGYSFESNGFPNSNWWFLICLSMFRYAFWRVILLVGLRNIAQKGAEPDCNQATFIANPAKSPQLVGETSQCHDPPRFSVANILLSRWPTCKLLGITYLANKKSSIFFLSLAHMVHGLSEISNTFESTLI